MPRANLPYRLRTVEFHVIATTVQLDLRHRQERLERLPDADRTRTGTAPAVGRRDGLVEAEVDDVEVHLARGRPPEDRVEVRAVVVQEAARGVEGAGDLEEVAVDEAGEGRLEW